MPINAHPDYLKAEKEYLNSKNLSDKIYWLEEMIRRAPSHKGAENLRAELRRRLKKLKEKKESFKKKTGKKGLRKEGFQFVLFGKTNVGKSLLLSKLTNANPVVADYPFTTKIFEIGTFSYEGVNAQVVDMPSLGSKDFDRGILNNADCLIVVVDNFDDLIEFRDYEGIFVFNKIDLLSELNLRKLIARAKSKRIDCIFISALKEINLTDLRTKMFEKMGVVRVYLKEPGKPVKDKPMVLKKGSVIKDVAEGIYKGFSKNIKEVRVTGLSVKFANQKVGLKHVIRDGDIVEFHTY